MKWNTQMTRKGGVLSSLNQRLFVIWRLRNSLNDEGLRKVAESLFTFKLRYGLQLFGQVRWSEEDPSPLLMAQLQKSQNKLQIENKWQSKHQVNAGKHNMLGVNQINAQIKLTEMWKAINDEDHSSNIQKPSLDKVTHVTRSLTNGEKASFWGFFET